MSAFLCFFVTPTTASVTIAGLQAIADLELNCRHPSRSEELPKIPILLRQSSVRGPAFTVDATEPLAGPAIASILSRLAIALNEVLLLTNAEIVMEPFDPFVLCCRELARGSKRL